jgi:hypothetical protein
MESPSMLLQHRSVQPRALIRVALALIAANGTLAILVHPRSGFWSDLLDGVRGAGIGAALALIVWSQIVARRRTLHR